MINTLAFDISVGTWLKYAIVSIPNHMFTAIPILLITFSFLLLIVGIIWGKLWNKKWSLTASPLRILCVGSCSLMAALSLVSADIIQSNGSMFQGNVGPAVKQLSPNENNEVRVTSEDAAYSFLKDVEKAVGTVGPSEINDFGSGDDQSTQNTDILVFTPSSIDSYSSSIMLLWIIFGACLIMLISGVALVGYSDIKEVKSVA